jgi:hypothetical protein
MMMAKGAAVHLYVKEKSNSYLGAPLPDKIGAALL